MSDYTIGRFIAVRNLCGTFKHNPYETVGTPKPLVLFAPTMTDVHTLADEDGDVTCHFLIPKESPDPTVGYVIQLAPVSAKLMASGAIVIHVVGDTYRTKITPNQERVLDHLMLWLDEVVFSLPDGQASRHKYMSPDRRGKKGICTLKAYLLDVYGEDDV